MQEDKGPPRRESWTSHNILPSIHSHRPAASPPQLSVTGEYSAIFFPASFFYTFLSFMAVREWGFGYRVLDWVFGVFVFSWWGNVPVVAALLRVFLGSGSLYKQRRINLGKTLLVHYIIEVNIIWFYSVFKTLVYHGDQRHQLWTWLNKLTK